MNNIERIKAAVREHGLDAMLITSEANRLFATGFHSTAGVVLVTGSSAWFFTDSRYFEAASMAVKNAIVQPVDRFETYGKRINFIIEDCGIKTLGFEEAAVTYGEFTEWSSKLKADLTASQKLLTSLRAVKSREDLSEMIDAQRIAEKSFAEILPLISTDITEKDLAAELLYRCLRNGADDKSFDFIVVSGERSSMPHGVPTDKKIQKGFLTIDFGVKKNGWCSDTTRTVCVGEPTEEMRRVYDIVLQAQLAGIETARAGVKGREIDEAARHVIDIMGYGNYFGHGFGHGLGLEVHEAPNAAPSADVQIPAGAVISAEPGIYLPGRFGVRIEDVLYITAGGSENITKLQKKLIVL
jgi:Xaa-Pro aminopeptidase